MYNSLSNLIFWDEIGTCVRNCVEGIDRSVSAIMKSKIIPISRKLISPNHTCFTKKIKTNDCFPSNELLIYFSVCTCSNWQKHATKFYTRWLICLEEVSQYHDFLTGARSRAISQHSGSEIDLHPLVKISD